MSKLRKDYETTLWYRLLCFVNGEEKPQEEQEEHVRVEEDKTIAIVPEDIWAPVEGEKQKLYDMYRHWTLGRGMKLFHKLYTVFAVFICVVIIGTLLYTVSYLPSFGDAHNPDNNEVAARYIEKGLQETGAVNIVTGMILDYRAFDTLGESHVLFVAAAAVMILLRLDKSGKGNQTQEKAEENDRIYEPKNYAILQKVAKVLVPPIIIFGIYAILNGHLSPGGGFSGGSIIGAGLILYLNAFGFAKTERFFTYKTYKRISIVSLGFYALSKSYSFYTGANHLESFIPKGTPGAILSSGLILPLNICVGMVVACTMYGFYAVFRKGGM